MNKRQQTCHHISNTHKLYGDEGLKAQAPNIKVQPWPPMMLLRLIHNCLFHAFLDQELIPFPSAILLILFFFFLLSGQPSSKKPKALSFQVGSGWNLAGSLNMHRSTRLDFGCKVMLSRRRQTFHADKCAAIWWVHTHSCPLPPAILLTVPDTLYSCTCVLECLLLCQKDLKRLGFAYNGLQTL